MKRTFLRRGLAALVVGIAVTGAAFALGKGDSLISLSYLNKNYIPTLVAQGASVQDEKMTQAYDAAIQELEQLTGQGSGQNGTYSADFRARSYTRGDQISLETGAGFLLLSGQAEVSHSGAVVDVTQGQTVVSGGTLSAGHRYLVGEDTVAKITITSGIASAGVQGSFQWDKSGEKAAPFIDVSSGDWYSTAVDYAYFNGLFSGMGDDQFAPQSSMDRAMMMTVLYHLAGSPESERLAAKATFQDVPADQWFSSFVSWAAEKGVSAGTGDGQFSPNQPVTRQQVVVLLYNFATNYMGMSLSERTDISSCTDYGQVAFWSQDAMSWAAAGGIVSSGGALEPERSATRAEVASMLMNFSQHYLV